jgi:hypothetical protein
MIIVAHPAKRALEANHAQARLLGVVQQELTVVE